MLTAWYMAAPAASMAKSWAKYGGLAPVSSTWFLAAHSYGLIETPLGLKELRNCGIAWRVLVAIKCLER
jgi:hypothetical protein